MEMTGTNVPLTPEAAEVPENIKPEVDNPLERPDGRNKLELIKFYTLYPLYFVSVYTIPGKIFLSGPLKWEDIFLTTFYGIYRKSLFF